MDLLGTVSMSLMTCKQGIASYCGVQEGFSKRIINGMFGVKISWQCHVVDGQSQSIEAHASES